MRIYSVAERIAFVVTLAAVLVLALLPVHRLKQFGIDIGFHYDKLNHASAFAVLAFLGSLGWPRHKPALIVFLAFVGAAIEVLQGTTAIGRDFDVLDWVADCVGMACGLLAAICATWIVQRARREEVESPALPRERHDDA
ncbi:VanZ family protein [Mesorhizobium sp. BR1-1-2]|uniref:VanZ family protein n=2 Tax=unclassified Mesorhizobium TaxID=325217 RepID=UPI001CC9943A|nr:VanZ family protein [Mesorhizobium sp. BR1-1-2]MBZ9964995.1 VanZ family protein [Mesorhizobium sp. BR1-1-2]